jgi:translation initiation factor IF-2
MAKKQTKNISTRPPIVTIMGHVDHGKTSLLDTIRKSRIAQKEHGGITQHIGAYQITFQNKKITFIDTPGHAAFSQMRARGALVTDVVILVVAADDGVKPQTVESIKHIKEAKVPLIVAINKIDLPQASAETAKAQLTEHEIFVEGYGGQTPVVEISAKTGQGVDQLLELLLLVSEMEELVGDEKNPLQAVVIESNLDKKVGATATLIVRDGIITQGKYVFVDQEKVKVRMMINDLNMPVKTALPGDPVRVIGFKTPPSVGAVIGDLKQEVVTEKLDDTASVTDGGVEESIELGRNIREKMKLIIKADTEGTLEAIITSILQDEIELIQSGVGAVGEADVLLAHNTGAEIIGFNVKVAPSANKIAEIEKVLIHTFSIIYKLIEYVEEKVLTLIEPTINEEEIGKAKVEAIFLIRGERIAGCMVESGKIDAGGVVKVYRKDKVIGDANVKTIRQGKEAVKAGKAGKECGIVLEKEIDFRVGDVLKCYRISTVT